MDYRAKLDQELRDIYDSYLHLRSDRSDRVYPPHSVALRDEPVSLLMHFGGDIAGIEALGFRVQWVEGDFARGRVALADLPRVASHPEVFQLAYGGRYTPRLNTSTVEINARGSGKVWDVNTGTGAFTGNRGAGVIIGVIDTGIDITHPVFCKAGTTDTTRILRVWDMGLDPHDGIGPPDLSLLQGSATYGIEYTDAHINDVLKKTKGKPKVKHQDCFGHGTHVAGIAAGNGSAAVGKKKFDFVGVAPEADLIVVKMFYLAKEPPGGLNYVQLIEDAVTYVERTVKKSFGDRAFVINASLGESLGPHDGLDVLDLFLTNRFGNAKGRAMVASSGNDGDERQNGRIVVPTSGKIDVPFTMFDERFIKADTAHCGKARDNLEPEIKVDFWYPTLASGAVTATLVTAKGKTIAAPALGAAGVSAELSGKVKVSVTHEVDSAKRPNGTTVTRNQLRLKFTPGKAYEYGKFTLRVTAPAGTLIRAWCEQVFPGLGARVGHDKPKSDPTKQSALDRLDTLPTGMTFQNSEQVNSPASSTAVIAVANYNDVGGTLNDSSSRGPLVDYSGTGVLAAKPDVGAPGTKIMSAKAGTSVLAKLFKTATPYTNLDGSSMSAPHVAGMCALILEKKPTLALPDLVKAVRDHARAGGTADEMGKGKVDVKATRDAV